MAPPGGIAAILPDALSDRNEQEPLVQSLLERLAPGTTGSASATRLGG